MDRDSLLIDVRVGDSVSIDNGRVVLTLNEKSGQRVKMHFNAAKGVAVEPLRARAENAEPAKT